RVEQGHAIDIKSFSRCLFNCSRISLRTLRFEEKRHSSRVLVSGKRTFTGSVTKELSDLP
ncbi:hypothetical protein chiPu_0021706, partial [Chiloscyllium punctatum]|nr:hypothetical protein [Chiloscyllium punctatum]